MRFCVVVKENAQSFTHAKEKIQGNQKNRTHINFIKSYQRPQNFKKLVGPKLHSLYDHSSKF